MRTIDYFDKQATLAPDRPMLIAGDQRYTYGQMQALTHRLAGAMLDAGLVHQEAVAIMSPNDGAIVTAMLGLWRAGGVWIPVNTRNALADNIAYLNYVRAGWLFYHSSYSADAHEVKRQVPSIRHMICLDGADAGNPALADFMRPEGSAPIADLGDPSG
ncbi:MAG: hypothetical protein RIQ46_1495, partial [Pseudomonadota bacterium]